MKKWIGYSLTVLLISTGFTASAQKGHKKTPDINQRVEHLSKTLNLNADQQLKLIAILTKSREDALVIRKDNTTQETRRPKMLELAKSTDQQISSMLDAKQLELYKQHKAERKKELKEKRKRKHSDLHELEDEGIL